MTREPTYPTLDADDLLRADAHSLVEQLAPLDWHLSVVGDTEIHTATYGDARIVVLWERGCPARTSVTLDTPGDPSGPVWAETSVCYDFSLEEAQRAATIDALYAIMARKHRASDAPLK